MIIHNVYANAYTSIDYMINNIVMNYKLLA